MRVKGHYRHLPNGKIVFIDEYTDKRQAAQQQPEAFAGKVVHASPTQTTYVNHLGQPQTFAHQAEMTRPQIHAQLNRPLPVNADLAKQVVHHQLGITNHKQFLRDATEEEGMKSEPRFNDEKGAEQWFHETHVKPKLKELRQAHGKTTTPAKAFLHETSPDLREMWQSHAAGESGGHHEQALGKMLVDNAEDAHAIAELAVEQGERAQQLGPKNAPKINGISPKVKFYPHQAEALAKMNPVPRSPTDVDMGGGKGLLLPADALALMTQGKIKKPLIVVPTATLDPNATKLVDDYSDGGVNVFKISTESLARHYGGDISRLVEDVRNAPANTVFMATYDSVSHQDREGPERFAHAQALGAAGFDYVACDESHNVRNEESARFQALSHLCGAPYVRMASGTFLANNPSDVVGPLKLLFPHMDFDAKKIEKLYGRTETKEGVTWSREGLKRLRDDLGKLGMVSLRRSAWFDKLPKRTDALSVVHMKPEQEKIHEAVLNDAMDQIESEAEDDPILKRALDDAELDPDADVPPALMRRLEILQGVTDYPDELAKMIEGQIHLVGSRAPEDPEAIEALDTLKKFSPATRNALLSLKGVVSPKAEDVYKKAAAHLKDDKNGKFIVFVQRKASARHILEHMPAELKSKASYFDAGEHQVLNDFVSPTGGPSILVAVDASIKEGVNMQAANGLYRYDHHLTPGNQDQSLARVWRLGQTRPVKFHFGIVHGGMDVTRYARLCSKLSTNMQVVSDFEQTSDTPIYRLSLDNIRNKRDSSILDGYQNIVEEVLSHQKDENKAYKKANGDETHDLASGKPVAGGQEAHGSGAFHPRKLMRKAYRQPAHLGHRRAADSGGSRITKVTEDQRLRLRRVVADAIRNKDSTERLTRRLRHAANSGGHSGDDRDWKRVAVTEVNDARSRASLEHILSAWGPKTLIVRQTNRCCPECCRAFGKHVRRVWRADKVPEKYKGTVHPYCKCGPWVVANPIRKAFKFPAATFSFGTLRRDPHPDLQEPGVPPIFWIWSGKQWVELESVTGRSVMRAVLSRTPLVVVEDGPGWVLARVGHGRPLRGGFELLDPALANGRYFPANPLSPDRPKDYRAIAARSRDDYIEGALAILPVVCTMPEPWKGRSYADLIDFLGYKTFTDWWVLLPAARAAESFIADEDAGAQTARQAVMKWSRNLLAENEMRKSS